MWPSFQFAFWKSTWVSVDKFVAGNEPLVRPPFNRIHLVIRE